MRVGRPLRGLSAIGALLLTLTAGCTISIQPWSKPVTIAPGPTDFMPAPNGQNPFRVPIRIAVMRFNGLLCLL